MSFIASIFPYDPNVDSAIEHHHLVIAYCLVWTVQLGYLYYVCRNLYMNKQSDS
jgi:hypothetical protein